MNTLRIRQRQSSSAFTRIVGVLTIASVSPFNLSIQAIAQEPLTQAETQTWWGDQQKIDTRVTACRVSWNRIQRINPNPQADPEKWGARTLAWARQQGFDEKEAQRQAQGERREAEISRKGRTINTRLDFVRVGKSVRCEIVYPEIQSRAIEFSDGQNALFVWTQVKNAAVSKNANLTRDAKSVLSRSAGGEQVARFLLGIPFNEDFSTSNPSYLQANTSLKQSAEGSILMERNLDPNPRLTDSPALLTFSKAHLPTAYESFALNFWLKGGKYSRHKGKLLTRTTIEGYQQHKNGVWFPSKITVIGPISTTEYTLVKVAFNEAIDPMEMRLPADMRVADSRFGYSSKPAIYKLQNGQIPSDEEVRKMLNLDKEATQAKNAASQEVASPKPNPLSSLPIAPAAGLLLMAMGCMMWMRSGHNEHGA